jgi:hypothetical protein
LNVPNENKSTHNTTRDAMRVIGKMQKVVEKFLKNETSTKNNPII